MIAGRFKQDQTKIPQSHSGRAASTSAQHPRDRRSAPALGVCRWGMETGGTPASRRRNNLRSAGLLGASLEVERPLGPGDAHLEASLRTEGPSPAVWERDGHLMEPDRADPAGGMPRRSRVSVTGGPGSTGGVRSTPSPAASAPPASGTSLLIAPATSARGIAGSGGNAARGLQEVLGGAGRVDSRFANCAAHDQKELSPPVALLPAGIVHGKPRAPASFEKVSTSLKWQALSSLPGFVGL